MNGNPSGIFLENLIGLLWYFHKLILAGICIGNKKYTVMFPCRILVCYDMLPNEILTKQMYMYVAFDQYGYKFEMLQLDNSSWLAEMKEAKHKARNEC